MSVTPRSITWSLSNVIIEYKWWGGEPSPAKHPNDGGNSIALECMRKRLAVDTEWPGMLLLWLCTATRHWCCNVCITSREGCDSVYIWTFIFRSGPSYFSRYGYILFRGRLNWKWALQLWLVGLHTLSSHSAGYCEVWAIHKWISALKAQKIYLFGLICGNHRISWEKLGTSDENATERRCDKVSKDDEDETVKQL